jgi:hypothetical protein
MMMMMIMMMMEHFTVDNLVDHNQELIRKRVDLALTYVAANFPLAKKSYQV